MHSRNLWDGASFLRGSSDSTGETRQRNAERSESRGHDADQVRREACSAGVTAGSRHRGVLAVPPGSLNRSASPNLLHKGTVAELCGGGTARARLSAYARGGTSRHGIGRPPSHVRGARGPYSFFN